MRRLTLLGALMACAAIAFAGCGSSSDGGSSGGSGDGTKVALVLLGPAEDGGWNTIWQRSVAELRRAVPDADVTVVPNINPGAATQRTLQTLAQQGNELIVLTGGYADADIRKAARAFPDTQFLNMFGTTVGENVAPFSAAIEQGRYLDGIVAGSMTRTNKLGEVGGYPVPIEVRGLNAFANGVASVNPDARVKILWVNSYYDPAKERQAAQALADDDVDVLVMDSNTPAVSSVARSRDRMLVGYGISREKDAPRQWLGTFTFNWSPYLIEWTRAVADGTFESRLFYEGLESGVIGEAPYGESVPQDVLDKVEAARKQIVAGELDVFAGPLTDNQGSVVVPDGEAITDPVELDRCCTWALDNVEGNLGQSGG
jgi:basic membrane protein A and related proteins